MKFYTIGASKFSMLAASGFSGSAALSFVGYFLQAMAGIQSNSGFPKGSDRFAFINMVIFSAFTVVRIIVFVRTAARIKRKSGLGIRLCCHDRQRKQNNIG
jgi:hypothetical protein